MYSSEKGEVKQVAVVSLFRWRTALRLFVRILDASFGEWLSNASLYLGHLHGLPGLLGPLFFG